jgi:hypothetical protein
MQWPHVDRLFWDCANQGQQVIDCTRDNRVIVAYKDHIFTTGAFQCVLIVAAHREPLPGIEIVNPSIGDTIDDRVSPVGTRVVADDDFIVLTNLL